MNSDFFLIFFEISIIGVGCFFYVLSKCDFGLGLKKICQGLSLGSFFIIFVFYLLLVFRVFSRIFF